MENSKINPIEIVLNPVFNNDIGSFIERYHQMFPDCKHFERVRKLQSNTENHPFAVAILNNVQTVVQNSITVGIDLDLEIMSPFENGSKFIKPIDLLLENEGRSIEKSDVIFFLDLFIKSGMKITNSDYTKAIKKCSTKLVFHIHQQFPNLFSDLRLDEYSVEIATLLKKDNSAKTPNNDYYQFIDVYNTNPTSYPTICALWGYTQIGLERHHPFASAIIFEDIAFIKECCQLGVDPNSHFWSCNNREIAWKTTIDILLDHDYQNLPTILECLVNCGFKIRTEDIKKAISLNKISIAMDLIKNFDLSGNSDTVENLIRIVIESGNACLVNSIISRYGCVNGKLSGNIHVDNNYHSKCEYNYKIAILFNLMIQFEYWSIAKYIIKEKYNEPEIFKIVDLYLQKEVPDIPLKFENLLIIAINLKYYDSAYAIYEKQFYIPGILSSASGTADIHNYFVELKKGGIANPFLFAITNNLSSFCERLLLAGVNPNDPFEVKDSRYNGKYPVQLAKSVELLKILYSFGAY